MANIRYFADLPDVTLEFTRVDYINRKNIRGYSPVHGWVKVTRVVEYKSFPTRHECDARCYNATGKIMRCECSCGGKNHGKGAFNCVAA